MKDIPIIGLLLTELIFSFLYFNQNMSEVQLDVIRFIPQSIFIIWILIDKARYVRGFKHEVRIRKGLIYSVCMLYSIIIFLNLYYAQIESYYLFRLKVSNQEIITLGWFIIYIYLIYVATERWIKKLLNR